MQAAMLACSLRCRENDKIDLANTIFKRGAKAGWLVLYCPPLLSFPSRHGKLLLQAHESLL